MNDVKTLTDVLACCINPNFPKIQYTDEELNRAYLIAKEHNVTQIFAFSVIKNNLTKNENLLSEFNSVYFTAILRYNEINKTFAEIANLFETEKIDYLPLKGMVIRDYYPEVWMRSSRDIDILVKEDFYEKACELVRTKLNYHARCELSYDTAFTTPKGICVEIHKCLSDGLYLTEAETPLINVWDNSFLKSAGKHEYSMQDDLFLYYFIYHTAKHFFIGGCGVRPLLDFWFLNQRFPKRSEGLTKLLVDNKLDVFTSKMEQLCKVWFIGEARNQETDILEEYIIKGGQAGNKTVRHITAESPKKLHRKFYLSRVFVPFDDLKISYPILEKYPILATFCAVARIFSILFGKRKDFRIKRRNEAREKEAIHKQHTEKNAVKEYVSIMNIVGMDVDLK